MDVSQSNYSNAAQKIMSAMGYKAGLGLGKHNQGRVAPVDTSQQHGRRGLGQKLKGLKPTQNLEWDKSQDGQRRGHIPSLMDIPTQCLMGIYGSYQQNHGLYQQNHGSYQQNYIQMVMSSQIQAASSLIDRMTTKSEIVGAPAGKGITTGKGTEPAGAHPANSVKRSLTDISYDDKIKVARSSGHCIAINILQNISKVPIKYFEKSIGTVDSPIYECNAVFNGQKYRGVSRQKKLAKHAAAEATLQAIVQNWNAGKSDGVYADVLESLVDKVL